jgi:aminomethyltransferase
MKEYTYLTEHVSMWNVAVERQIVVKGPDATKFVDYVITRKAELCGVNKCKYVILCNQHGGVLNDPILLRPAEDEWWFSLADSDIGMYLLGINHDGRWDCEIKEIDVAPVQIQGPKAPALMADVFGESVKEMKYYDMIHSEIAGCPCVISASGFSTELGYEIYLRDATKNAEKMWYTMLEAGKKHNLGVIAPGHHRRIEAGILSYGADFDAETNPYECGLGWQVDLTKEAFIGKAALAKIKEEGVTHKLCGVLMGGEPITWYIADFYHVFHDGQLVGYITSAWHSPTQGSNIGFAFLPVDLTKIGTELEVALPTLYSSTPTVKAVVEKTPFKPPAKGNEGRGLRLTGTKL